MLMFFDDKNCSFIGLAGGKMSSVYILVATKTSTLVLFVHTKGSGKGAHGLWNETGRIGTAHLSYSFLSWAMRRFKEEKGGPNLRDRALLLSDTREMNG